jgi:hypothetical protein
MDNAQDIIQIALDILAGPDREIEVALVDIASAACRVRYGTLTGLGSMGDYVTITVDNYRATPGGDVITPRTLVNIDEIISLDIA